MSSGRAATTDCITDFEFSRLSLNKERFQNTRMRRPPTWNEIFLAARMVVDDALFDGGLCMLYATITAAIINVFADNPVGVSAGGIAIGHRRDVNAWTCIPRNPKQPNLALGGFHAWSVVEVADEPHIVDFALHWFHRATEVPGGICCPRNYVVARRETLNAARVYYHPNESLTHTLGPQMRMKEHKEMILAVGRNLKTMVGSAR